MKSLLTPTLLALAVCSCGKKDVPTLPEKVVGSCMYTNNFSGGQECRDYHGEWSEADLQADCKEWQGTATVGQTCDLGALLGHCILTKGNGRFTRISNPGTEAAKCGSTIRGCELFGGGIFDPEPICGGTVVDTGSGLPTFQQPQLTCKAPLPNEPPGQSDGGQVCTWEMISGATEPGRHFVDYASCDRVRTQRPYYAAPTAVDATRDDARLNDPTYKAEVEWVKGEVMAAACVCCHSTAAPRGASNWYVEQPGNFINGFYDRGLAMGAGWIDTVAFGAYPPEQNNGFSRATPDRPNDPIFPTTDVARMRRFFESELAFRGRTKEEFAAVTNGAGPLDEQRRHQPTDCPEGVGMRADGALTWTGSDARYVYVLDAGSISPGVPPNLDVPQGTRWRIDVASDGTPLHSGDVSYGVVPAGAQQRVPAQGSAAALQSGQKYYLYVMQDIAIPVARCLFVAP